jgi:HEAT repeat protein
VRATARGAPYLCDRYDRVVEELGVKHRARAAQRALMAAGSEATPALRRGLRHEDAEVRIRCCMVLDHHLDEAAVPELMANLAHENAGVRAWALHALACDRCKEGACRPGEDDVVPIALRMLEEDRSRRVRQMAAGLLGPAVHRRGDVASALERARDHDPHPVVRKVAGWYAPGGPIYARLAPKPVRERGRETATARA